MPDRCDLLQITRKQLYDDSEINIIKFASQNIRSRFWSQTDCNPRVCFKLFTVYHIKICLNNEISFLDDKTPVHL